MADCLSIKWQVQRLNWQTVASSWGTVGDRTPRYNPSLCFVPSTDGAPRGINDFNASGANTAEMGTVNGASVQHGADAQRMVAAIQRDGAVVSMDDSAVSSERTATHRDLLQAIRWLRCRLHPLEVSFYLKCCRS